MCLIQETNMDFCWDVDSTSELDPGNWTNPMYISSTGMARETLRGSNIY